MITSKILIITICLFFLFDLVKAETATIRVKIDEMVLVLEKEGQEIKRYSVAVPRSQNPYPHSMLIGRLKRIEMNPVWIPTSRTRAAFLRERGKILPSVIPSGNHLNAMGIARLIIHYENWPNHYPIWIHGTNEPSSIGKRVTRGCIRLHNDDILDLIERIKNLEKVKIIIEQ